MGLGSVAAIVVEQVLEPVEGMHRAIAQRWVRPRGRNGGAVAALHDNTLGLAYGSIRLGVAAAGMGLDQLAAGDTGRIGSATAVVNGLWGDDLGRHTESLEIDMSIRDTSGVRIGLDDVTDRLPDATGRLAILVHGFAQTESCWLAPEGQAGLHETLSADPLITPVLVRYNTGGGVTDSGADLANMLEDLIEAWPVPVEAVSLTGYSMGGLVSRAAIEYGLAESQAWISRLSDLIVLATPHEGSPIEKTVNLASHGLHRFSVTEPLGRFLDGRSRGIKDMRHGPDAPTLFPEHAKLHVAAATVTHDPRHPVGFIAGDLVIRESSARAMRDESPENTLIVGGTHHGAVPNNPEMAQSILEWLRTDV